MKKSLVKWSWLFPVLGLIVSVIVPIGLTFVNSAPPFFFFFVFVVAWISLLVFSILGFVSGIIAIRRIKKKSKLKGRNQAIIGLILSSFLLVYVLLGLYMVSIGF